MLLYVLPLISAIALLSSAVALIYMAHSIRTAVKAKPKQLKEFRVEFSKKRRIVMQWQDPAPPRGDSRPRLVRDEEGDDAA